MDAFKVVGGKRLQGEFIPQGAKNEALQVLSAVLLTSEKVTLRNVPLIRDVLFHIELLRELGVKVEQTSSHTFTFQADEVRPEALKSPKYLDKAIKTRGSILLVGPMLGRFNKAYLPKPGGDKIGRRRLDTHYIGFKKLGAKLIFDDKAGNAQLATNKLTGTYMHLDEASVTGTASIVMAAVLAQGQTTIYNAACEPYVQQLCRMLVNMGAKIEGIGSNLLHIDGVEQLGGCTHELLPDMIEIGSFIGLAAMTQSEITIKNVRYDMLGLIPTVFRNLGIHFEHTASDDIYIPAQDSYEISSFIDGSILTVSDAPWPGFTPDLLSIVLVVATQAVGNVLIHQKMFESRLFFVDKLIDMGAQIILCDPHRANVMGLGRRSRLKGITMSSPDIRAGVALLIAALSADGKSTIYNAHQIDRGYQQIDERLRKLGAEIERV